MHSGRKIKIEAPIAISGVLIFVLALLALVLPALAAPVAEVVISDASAYPTETTSIPIIINNAENVGVVDLNLRYDPSVVRVIDVAGGDFDTTIPNLEHKDNGSVRIGAFQTDNPGLNKSVITIARITLEAVGNAGSTSTLDIIVNEFKDATPEGKHIDYTITNGKFTVKSSNGDGGGGRGGGGGDGAFIPSPSPTPTLTATLSPTETLTSTPAPIITPSAIVTPTQTPTSTSAPVPRLPPLFLILIVIAVIVIAGIIIIIVLRR